MLERGIISKSSRLSERPLTSTGRSNDKVGAIGTRDTMVYSQKSKVKCCHVDEVRARLCKMGSET